MGTMVQEDAREHRTFLAARPPDQRSTPQLHHQ